MKIKELAKTNQRYQNEIEEINHRNELFNSQFQKFNELIQAVHTSFIQSGRVLHYKNIREKLNSLFNFAKLNTIAFYDPQLSFQKAQTENVSIKPTLPLKINRFFLFFFRFFS